MRPGRDSDGKGDSTLGKKIYKYAFPPPKPRDPNHTFIITMPKGAQVLSVQTQDQDAITEGPRIWALVDPDAEVELVQFEVFPTGYEIRDDLLAAIDYVGTFQVFRGRLVFHVFKHKICKIKNGEVVKV